MTDGEAPPARVIEVGEGEGEGVPAPGMQGTVARNGDRLGAKGQPLEGREQTGEMRLRTVIILSTMGVLPLLNALPLFGRSRQAASPRWKTLMSKPVFVLGMAVTVTGCGGTSPSTTPSGQAQADDFAPVVVAADGVLCDLAERLAAGDLKVECLLRAGDDPHSFRLQPSQKALLSSAPLVLISGYGLTPALADLPGAVAVSELAVPASLLLSESADQQHHDQDHDHDHGDQDPHVWHNPANSAAMVGVIADRFSALVPGAAGPIRQRAAAMEEVLQRLNSWNTAQFATVPAPPPPLASGHRAFASLAQAYGLRELSLVDAHSSSETLRPEQFRVVVENLRTERVPQLFAEQLPAPRSLQRISELSGVPIAPVPLAADGLAQGQNGPLSLVASLTRNTCTIVTGWGGRCDEVGAADLNKRWTAIP